MNNEITLTIMPVTEVSSVILPTAEECDMGGWHHSVSAVLELYLDPTGETPEVKAMQGPKNSGVPLPAHNKIWRRLFRLEARVEGQSVVDYLSQYEEEILALASCFEGSEWDGNNHVGQWSEDVDEKDPWICGAPDAMENFTIYWAACEWLCDHVVDPFTTDAELDEEAADLVAEGAKEYVVVTVDDVRSVLESLREDEKVRYVESKMVVQVIPPNRRSKYTPDDLGSMMATVRYLVDEEAAEDFVELHDPWASVVRPAQWADIEVVEYLDNYAQDI